MSALKIIRKRLAEQLDPELRTREGLSLINKLVVITVIVSLLVAVLATEPVIHEGREAWFHGFELLFLALFTIEYLARVWTSIENKKVTSRWRYMMQPLAIIDLLVILLILFSLMGGSGFLLRLVRILRVISLSRLGRFSAALRLMGQAINERRFELMISAGVAFLLVFISSSLLYLVEGGIQPEEFGSIPRAMWWSVVTLTTVGYGDAYPITGLGRVFGAMTALAGIALIAVPTGIVAGALSEAISESRKVKVNVRPSSPEDKT